MVDSLYRSLCSFLRQSRSGAGPPLAFALRIQHWSLTEGWQQALRRLTAAEQVKVLTDVAHRAFDRDLAQCRTQLESNARRVAWIGGPRDRRRLLRDHCVFLFVSLLDPLVLSERAARRDALARVELIGAEHVHRAMSGGRGAVFVGCHQTHGGYAFRQSQFAQFKFTIVRDDSDDPKHRQWREAGYGKTVDFAPATVAGVERLLNQLGAGGGVVLYNDFCIPGTTALPGTLFGRPVVISRSLVKLILRRKPPVLPVSVVRQQPFDSRVVRVELFPPLTLDDLSESKTDQIRAATRLAFATECLIRRYPVQWTHWEGLERRWSEAANVWAKFDPSPLNSFAAGS
jgi:lauroyl/myristoyl acyltransferase